MRKIAIFTALVLLLGITNLSIGQISLVTPSFQFGASVGYATYSGSDAFTNDLGKGGIGISKSIRFGAKARLSLPMFPINFVVYYYHAPLNSDADLGALGKLEYSSSLNNIGIGVELPLMPGPVKPYFAVDYLITKFGESTTTMTAPGQNPVETKFGGTNRSGIGIGAGLRFTLLPVIDLDASVKYNKNNLFGKDDGEDTINSIAVMATVLISL